MQATKGFAVLSRTRTRLIGCSLAVALSALVLASTASAKPSHEGYLALGDSLAFGYSQQLFNENSLTGESPTAFENGYANDFKALVQKKGGLPLTNNGCPGETSDSMIGNGPLGTAMAKSLGTTTEAPCAYHYLAGLPLHNEYGGTKSQLESALEVIATSPKSHPITTLTLNIGANDELHAIAKCEAEVKGEFEKTGKSVYGKAPEEAVKNCISIGAFPLFKHIVTNMVGSLFVLRNGSSFGGVNYTGKIVVQGGYDPYGSVFTPGKELLEQSLTLVAILNFQEAKNVAPLGACFANPEPTFNPAVVGKPLEEPARLQAFTNMANFTEFLGKKNGPDIHPTPLGYEELANIMHAQCP